MYSSCNKITDAIQALSIDWSGVDVTVTIPIVTDVSATTEIGTGSFTYNLDSLIDDKSAGKLHLKNIDKFTLTKCTVTITNPDATNNFANFVSADATLATTAKTTPVTIGSVTSNPDTYADVLNIPVDMTTNLVPYISPTGSTTFHYVVHAMGRRVTTHELTASVHVEYKIHVTP